MEEKVPVTTIAHSDLVQVVGELGSRFGAEEDLRGLRPVRSWESRTSTLYHLASEDGTGVVLKVGKAWTTAKAREVYEDLRALGDLLNHDPRLRIGVPRVFGFHDDPPSVCIAYVPGEDLSRKLSRRPSYLSSEVADAIEQCGYALGVFHSDGLIESVDIEELQARLVKMARRILVSSDFVKSFDLTGLVSRRYGDFAPYNVRVTEEGAVCVLDQPSTRAVAPIHRDVSYFLYRVERRLHQCEDADPAELKRVQRRLQRIFLSAYAETGPRPLDSPDDEALMALYAAHKNLRTARKRLQQRKYSDAPRFVAMALRERKRALRIPSAARRRASSGRS